MHECFPIPSIEFAHAYHSVGKTRPSDMHGQVSVETELPDCVTRDHFFGLLASAAFRLTPMVPMVGLVEGTFLSLAPTRGALERVVVFKLVPSLVV